LTGYKFEGWNQGCAASHLVRLDRVGRDDLDYLVFAFEDKATKIWIDIVVVLRGIIETGVERGKLMTFALEQKKVNRREEQVWQRVFLPSRSGRLKKFWVFGDPHREAYVKRGATWIDRVCVVAEALRCSIYW